MEACAPQPSGHASNQTRNVAASGLGAIDIERDSWLIDKMPVQDDLPRTGRLRPHRGDDDDVDVVHKRGW